MYRATSEGTSLARSEGDPPSSRDRSSIRWRREGGVSPGLLSTASIRRCVFWIRAFFIIKVSPPLQEESFAGLLVRVQLACDPYRHLSQSLPAPIGSGLGELVMHRLP